MPPGMPLLTIPVMQQTVYPQQTCENETALHIHVPEHVAGL